MGVEPRVGAAYAFFCMAERRFDPKETVIEAFYAAKDLVEGLIADFQSSDKFFKYKLGVVVSWVALSLGTLGVACPGTPNVNENKLGATVRVVPVGEETGVMVLNESQETWKDVKLLLNNQFNFYSPSLAPEGRLALTLKQFAGPTGTPAPKDLHPNTLKITCSEGSSVIDLNVVAPQAP
jgi:hypothetical protein